jgi:hypothetical protein
VFTSTASTPISIAVAACEGAPSPASTTTGTFACSTMISTASRVRRPWFEPIHEPSGMTVAQPASSSRLHRIGSALQYGNTVKPSATSISAARNVSTGSGNRYRGSGVTSSFTHVGMPIAFARRARRTASSASAAPEVFGSNR